MKRKNIEVVANGLGTLQAKLFACFAENVQVIYFLTFVAICAYGFELFNFNLTIDEEIHATRKAPALAWITQGRWGTYVLNRFLLPYTVIPFVPLFTALLFHIAAIPLMLSAWDMGLKKRDQIMIGSIAITFPILAYIYMFSTLGYSIGAGFLCIASSLFIYKQGVGLTKSLAILPAAFAIAIYQGFIPALVSIYLIYMINTWIREGTFSKHELLAISGVHLGAIAIYVGVHGLMRFFVTFPESNYLSQFFGLQTLVKNFFPALNQILLITKQIYLGDAAVYGLPVHSLPYLLGVSFIGLWTKIYASKVSWLNKTILALLSVTLLALPFSIGILLRWFGMRFLIAVPVVTAGMVFLGLNSKSRWLDTAILFFTLWTVFQFIITTNHLFASSHLALQADRVLASRVIERIELAKAEAGTTQVQYLEVIGFLDRKPTQLIPKIETFGASFFEWDQGISGRIVLFFQTLGYDSLQPAPADLQIQMIESATTMPAWPEKGSIKIVGNVVLLKFGPYSHLQKIRICSAIRNQTGLQNHDFCR